MSHRCSLANPSLRISVNNTPGRAGFFQVYAYIDELGRKQMPRFAGGGPLIKPPRQPKFVWTEYAVCGAPHQIYTRPTCLSHKTNKIVDEQARYAKLTIAALKMHLGVPACSQKALRIITLCGRDAASGCGGGRDSIRPCRSKWLTILHPAQAMFFTFFDRASATTSEVPSS
jgi:hypothetical protein